MVRTSNPDHLPFFALSEYHCTPSGAKKVVLHLS